jgi:hypothetical protein
LADFLKYQTNSNSLPFSERTSDCIRLNFWDGEVRTATEEAVVEDRSI